MDKHFTQWMEEARLEEWRKMTERLLLADGTSLSIQASETHYCAPRSDMAAYSDYYEFEIGFPTSHIAELEKYQDDAGDQTSSVFGYVPVAVIEALIAARGGVVGIKPPKAAA